MMNPIINIMKLKMKGEDVTPHDVSDMDDKELQTAARQHMGIGPHIMQWGFSAEDGTRQ